MELVDAEDFTFRSDSTYLVGVSGLKEGESYRLYPLGAGMRSVPDFPHTELSATGDFPGPSLDLRSPAAGQAGALRKGLAAAAALRFRQASMRRRIRDRSISPPRLLTRSIG